MQKAIQDKEVVAVAAGLRHSLAVLSMYACIANGFWKDF